MLLTGGTLLTVGAIALMKRWYKEYQLKELEAEFDQLYLKFKAENNDTELKRQELETEFQKRLG